MKDKTETIDGIIREMREDWAMTYFSEGTKKKNGEYSNVAAIGSQTVAARIEKAHTREIREKYLENNRLREIVKELANKLQSSYCCVDGESHFDTCDITGICPDAATCALVSRAKEVSK